MKKIIGYPENDFLGHKYITLCSGGIKGEGKANKVYEDPIDAWDDFEEQLENFLNKYNKKECTLIWRKKPVLVESDYGVKCYVLARLVVYPGDIYTILKEKGFYFGRDGNPRFNNGHCLPHNINEIPQEKWEKLLYL